MSSLISVSMKAGSNDHVLQIRSVRNGYGQAQWRLTENQVYHLTFEALQSNPTDDDSNPLDLLGGALTFDFRTATLPQIDFYASTIGGKKVSTVATASGDVNRYQLPAAVVSNTSSVVDLKLKFTKSMNFDSLKDVQVSLEDLGSSTSQSFRIRDLDGGSHPSLLGPAALTGSGPETGTMLEIKAEAD